MDDSRREKELKKVVFHGCNAAAGTQMTLDRPSLQKPFFVSTHPDIALFYVNLRTQEMMGRSVPTSGSVYVMKLTGEPDEISMNLYQTSGLNTLKRTYPATAQAYHKWVQNTHVTSAKSLRGFSMAVMHTFVSTVRPNWYKLKELDWETTANVMTELHLAEIEGYREFRITDREIQKLFDDYEGKERRNYSEDIFELTHGVERRIKAKVNEVALKAGYYMVGDYDTSGTTSLAYEYAVLDLRALKKSTATSVGKNDITDAIVALLD